MATKVYGYIRVSSRNQIDKSGFKRQTDTIKSYAASNNCDVVQVYKDKAVSGTKGQDERPAFKEMVAAILANGVKTIIVERLDRFARSYVVQEQILVYLASKGITLINASTHEDVTAAISADPMKKALIQMQGVFSELDKSNLVLRLKKGREIKKAKTGRCEGQLPFGSTEHEREVVKKIKLKRRPNKNGKRPTLKEIAAWLNDQDITTKLGKAWSITQVKRVLDRKN